MTQQELQCVADYAASLVSQRPAGPRAWVEVASGSLRARAYAGELLKAELRIEEILESKT